MKYNSLSHMNSVKDVEVFFDHIVKERKINFHPDNDFEDYINIASHKPSFTSDECSIYNRLMDESFAVCKKEGVDIY